MESLAGSLKALAPITDKLPAEHVLTAVFAVVFFTAIVAVLKSNLIGLISPNVRDQIVLYCVRYGFAALFIIILGGFAQGVASTNSRESSLSRHLLDQAQAKADAPPSFRQQLQDIASELVRMSNRFNRPAGIDVAIRRLEVGDSDPAIEILREDLAQRRAEGSISQDAAAKRLRDIGLLAQLQDTALALSAYEEAVTLDPGNWQAWEQLALLRDRIGDTAGAEAAIQRVRMVGNEQSDPVALAAADAALGRVRNNQGNLAEAETLIKSAIDRFKQAGAQEALASQYASLANVLKTEGKLDAAEEYFHKALGIDQEINNQLGMAIDYGGLGQVFFLRKDYDRAERFYTQSLELNEKVGSRIGAAIRYGNLARVYRARKGEENLAKAEAYHEKALQIEQELNHPLGMSYEYANWAEIYLDRKDYLTAEEYLEKALELSRQVNSKTAMAVQYSKLGYLKLVTGDLDMAERNFRQAIALDRVGGRRIGIATNQNLLGHVFKKQGHIEKACEAWNEAHRIYTDLNEYGDRAKKIEEYLRAANCTPS